MDLQKQDPTDLKTWFVTGVQIAPVSKLLELFV